MASLQIGKLVVTKGILDEFEETYGFKGFCMNCLLRHRACDWGDLCEEDKEMNDRALKTGDRVLSAYDIPKFFCFGFADKIWIITEADRSATTILFPYEY